MRLVPELERLSLLGTRQGAFLGCETSQARSVSSHIKNGRVVQHNSSQNRSVLVQVRNSSPIRSVLVLEHNSSQNRSVLVQVRNLSPIRSVLVLEHNSSQSRSDLA
ncbi:Hypothetical protein NTJ_16046 [Nesidiocoris tenuis]|uniref:Uncharacterized protein n=1 Tax=Nesidiocoris tenuis TaxID=355587 RepID=A0ABN7BFV1_9HEMI|nr:Hypothetical protein NTJ_16046 [Nesidiocoris tenuis]